MAHAVFRTRQVSESRFAVVRPHFKPPPNGTPSAVAPIKAAPPHNLLARIGYPTGHYPEAMSRFHPRNLLAHIVVSVFALLSSAMANAQSALGRIPPAQGTLLSGQSVVLPAALHGKPGVVVIGFSQSARDEVTNWGRRLGADYFGSPDLAYYEVAMLAEVPGFLRGFVTRKIREGVSQQGQMHFLPVADHEAEWKAAAGYSRPDAAYVLLLDSEGNVTWRMAGAFTASSYAELQRRLQIPAR